MALIISCDRYYMKDNKVMIPISKEDSNVLGDIVSKPWVLVTNDTTILRESRYDREENIEDIYRVDAAYSLEEDIYLTTPFDTMNGMKPAHCTRYNKYIIFNNSPINPQSKIIGPLGNFIESLVSEKYNNVDKYADKSYLEPFLKRYSKIVDTENEQSLKELYDDISCLNNNKLFIKNPYHKDVNGCVDISNVLNNSYNPFYIYELLETNPVFEYWSYQTPRFLLLQEKMIMNYETRFFVVNGEIVTASGRVIDFVPTRKSIRNPFYYADKAVAYQSHSNDNQEVEVNPYYNYMLDYVKDMINTIKDNEKDSPTCVIDIAWSPREQSPVLVEINSISNSGLYGCSAHAVYNELYKNDCYHGLTLEDCEKALNNMFKKSTDF